MRHYNTLTWPQNTKNPISEDPNVKNFPGEDAPGPFYTTQPNIVIRKATLKDTVNMQILYSGSDLTFDQFIAIYISCELKLHSQICTLIKHL